MNDGDIQAAAAVAEHQRTATVERRREQLQLRLGADRFRPGVWGWIIPAVVTLVAGLLRFAGISNPPQLIFDETYYAKDAYSLLLAGYELAWPEESDQAFIEGHGEPQNEGSYVVHPPLGKWLIAVGIHLFGTETALGWRFAPAVAGVIAVLLVTLIAQRMFRSVFLGGVAGLLTAVEGHHLVMSRVALLDIFLTMFVLAAFGALLLDRWHSRRRLAQWGAQLPQQSLPRLLGPVLWWRPWQVLAAVLLGCAVAVKLSGLAFVAVFGIMVILWDMQARRTLGIRRWVRAGLLRDGLPAVLTVLPLVTLTYVLSWSGWLISSGGWGRQWHTENPAEGFGAVVPGPLRSLWNYHTSATDFHTGLDSGHEYASSAWTWPFMGRPVSMHYETLGHSETYQPTGELCTADTCSSAVLDLANPLIWWAGAVAICWIMVLWIGRRDYRYGAMLAGVVAGWAVWLIFPERTTFFFYTISYHPFLILAITAMAGHALSVGTSAQDARGNPRSWQTRISAQQRNTVMVLCGVLLAVAVSVFFWPIWTAEPIPYEQWRLRMWIQSWI